MKLRSKAGNRKVRHPKAGNRGFTLIEMMVVISLILILLSIAMPMYNQSIVRAKEARLHQDLKTLNEATNLIFCSVLGCIGKGYSRIRVLRHHYNIKGAIIV